MQETTAAELADPARRLLLCERLRSDPGGPPVVVDLRDDRARPAPEGIGGALATVPRVLVAVTGSGGPDAPAGGTLAAAADVAVHDDAALTAVADAVAAQRVAATALALLLRAGVAGDAGLVAESATYSALQGGAAHRAWLEARTPRGRPPEEGAAVRLERDGDRLRLTLSRPHVRNAFDRRMRDELLAGLTVAATDPAISQVVLDGEGPAFCSGGDLDEFGTAPDPAAAHVLRLGRSVAAALAGLSPRVVARVHGPCVGAGIELAAFADRVVGRPDASFRLPEVAMGLVPGAGGTVSIPTRIGRHRTAWMALTGMAVDAATALAWGLVDEIDEPGG